MRSQLTRADLAKLVAGGAKVTPVGGDAANPAAGAVLRVMPPGELESLVTRAVGEQLGQAVANILGLLEQRQAELAKALEGLTEQASTLSSNLKSTPLLAGRMDSLGAELAGITAGINALADAVAAQRLDVQGLRAAAQPDPTALIARIVEAVRAAVPPPRGPTAYEFDVERGPRGIERVIATPRAS